MKQPARNRSWPLRVGPVLFAAAVLVSCTGPSGEHSAADGGMMVDPPTDGGDGGLTSLEDATTDDTGTIVSRPDTGTPTDGNVWCPLHEIAKDDPGLIEFVDLGSTGEVLHAVGSCDGVACWFAGAAAESDWHSEPSFVDDRGQAFVDVGCSLEWCVGATEASLFASDGADGLPLVGPDPEGATFVASSVGPARVVVAGSNSSVWLMRGEPSVEASWEVATPGAVRDFAGTGASLRFAVGESVWELGADDTWTPTEFAENMQHAAVAGDTLFLTGGREFVAVNTGFTQTATVTTDLGRVAAFDRLGDTHAVIVAGERLLSSTGRQPSNMAVGTPPASPFVGVTYTSDGAPWALTRDGVLYGWSAGDSCSM